MDRNVYAAYGSNMNIEQMKIRCPKAKVIGTGELQNYQLMFRGKQIGVANIERFPQGRVPIVLWAITDKCEKALDRYEGYPKLYEKAVVPIETVNGQIMAMVYVMTKQYENMPAIPSEYYFEVILKGYLDNGIDTAFLLESLARAKNEQQRQL